MKNLQKHMLKIANSSPKNREVLSLVNYDSDTNTINVTDSFRVISVKSDTPIDNTINIDFKTMIPSSLAYPNIDRVLPNKGFDDFRIDLSNSYNEADYFLKKNKKGMSKLYIKGNTLFIECNDDNTIDTFEFGLVQSNDRVIGYFNNKYLCDLIDFVSDKIKTDTNIAIRHSSDTRPVSFIFDNKYTYVLTPIRVK